MGDPRASGENLIITQPVDVDPGLSPLARGIKAATNLRGRGPSPVIEFSSCQVGWFAVFSGVADKNASEPGSSLRASAGHREVSPSKNWFSTDSQNPQAPLWLVNIWYIVLAAPTFALWQ